MFERDCNRESESEWFSLSMSTDHSPIREMERQTETRNDSEGLNREERLRRVIERTIRSRRLFTSFPFLPYLFFYKTVWAILSLTAIAMCSIVCETQRILTNAFLAVFLAQSGRRTAGFPHPALQTLNWCLVLCLFLYFPQLVTAPGLHSVSREAAYGVWRDAIMLPLGRLH